MKSSLRDLRALSCAISTKIIPFILYCQNDQEICGNHLMPFCRFHLMIRFHLTLCEVFRMLERASFLAFRHESIAIIVPRLFQMLRATSFKMLLQC